MLSFKPCFPEAAHAPPASPDWLHEIKHDGYRMLARRDGERVHLISRRGLDWAWWFPMIVAAVEALAVRSCLIDGEVIACDADGVADFQLLRWRRQHDPVMLCAFDLIELDGCDLRGEPIEERKAVSWRGCLVTAHRTLSSTVCLGTRDRSSSSKRASSAAKGSSPSGGARAMPPVGLTTGSRSRIRTRQRSTAKRMRTGADEGKFCRYSPRPSGF